MKTPVSILNEWTALKDLQVGQQGTIELGDAGSTFTASGPDVLYATAPGGTHLFGNGNIELQSGYYYKGNGVYLEGIVSLPNDVLANSFASNSYITFGNNVGLLTTRGANVVYDTLGGPTSSHVFGNANVVIENGYYLKGNGYYIEGISTPDILANSVVSNTSVSANVFALKNSSGAANISYAQSNVYIQGANVVVPGASSLSVDAANLIANASGVYANVFALRNSPGANIAYTQSNLYVQGANVVVPAPYSLAVDAANLVANVSGVYANANVQVAQEISAGSLVVTGSADILGNAGVSALELGPGTSAVPTLTFVGSNTSGLYANAASQISTAIDTIETLTVAAGAVRANANVQVTKTGSAAAPSLYFGTDASSGLYAPAAGQVSVASGGLQRVLVDNLGNVTANANLIVSTLGSAATPSLRIGTATDTGMYAPSTSELALATAGVERVRSNATALFSRQGIRVGTGINDPGTLIEKRYNSVGDRYGMGQYFGGILRLYHSGVSATDFSIRFASAVNDASETVFTDFLISNVTGTTITGNANVSGVVAANTGTVAKPSYTFYSANSTGLYLSNATTGNVGVSANGNLALEIAPGNVTANANLIVSKTGAATTPSLYFGTDTSSGLYAPATGQVSVSAAGAQRFRVDATGGIVIGNANVSGVVLASNGTALQPAYTFYNANSSGIYLDGVSNVGISSNGVQRVLVSNAAATTYVVGNLNVDGAITSGTGEIVLEDLVLDGAAGNAVLTSSVDGVLGTDSGVRAYAGNVLGANTLTLQNVSLATSVDANTLSVSYANVCAFSNAIVVSNLGSAATPSLRFGTDASSGLYQPATGQIAVVSGGLQRVLIDNLGNLTANANLVVSQSGTSAAPSLRIGTATNTGFYAPTSGQVSVATGGVEYFRVSNVGVTANITGNLAVAPGSAANPALVFDADASSGFFQPVAGQVAIATAGIQRLGVDAGGLLLNGNLTSNVSGSAAAPAYTFLASNTSGIYLESGSSNVGISSNGAQQLKVSNAAGTTYIVGNLDVSGNVAFGNLSVQTIETSGELETGSLVVVGSGDILGNASASNVDIAQNLSFTGSNVFLNSPAANTLSVATSNAFLVSTGNLVVSNVGTSTIPTLRFGTDTASGFFAPATGQVSVASGGLQRLLIDNLGNISANANLIVSQLGAAATPSFRIGTSTNTGLFAPNVSQVSVATVGVQRLLVDDLGNLTANANLIVSQLGAAATPSLRIGTATDTGFYQPAAGNVSISTGGVERLRANAGGLYVIAGSVFAPDGTPTAPTHAFSNSTTSGVFLGNVQYGNVSVTANGTQRLQVSNVSGGLVSANANVQVQNTLYFGSDSASSINGPATGQVAVNIAGVQTLRVTTGNVVGVNSNITGDSFRYTSNSISETTANVTLPASVEGRFYVANTSVNDITITLPATFGKGFYTNVVGIGPGTVTFDPVPLNASGHSKLAAEYSVGQLLVLDNPDGVSASWLLAGDTAA